MSEPTPVPRPRSSRVAPTGPSHRPRQPQRHAQPGSISAGRQSDGRERGKRENLSQENNQEKFFFGYWQEVIWLVAWTLLGLLITLSIWLFWLIP